MGDSRVTASRLGHVLLRVEGIESARRVKLSSNRWIYEQSQKSGAGERKARHDSIFCLFF